MVTEHIFTCLLRKVNKRLLNTNSSVMNYSNSNSLMSFLDEDKFNSERLVALKYIKERTERAETVQNILAPITSQDEYIFDVASVDDKFSEASDLSDPFAELGGNIILSAESKQKRRLSKVEADVLVMNSFPAVHMEIQNKLLALTAPSEFSIEKFFETDDDSNDDSESLQQVSSLLSQVGLKSYKEEKLRNFEKEKLRPKPRSKAIKAQEHDADANSLLSGVWRMLDAASMDEDNFPITQLGYSFYDEKRTLVNPTEETWDKKEEVRKKCEDWLKNVKA